MFSEEFNLFGHRDGFPCSQDQTNACRNKKQNAGQKQDSRIREKVDTAPADNRQGQGGSNISQKGPLVGQSGSVNRQFVPKDKFLFFKTLVHHFSSPQLSVRLQKQYRKTKAGNKAFFCQQDEREFIECKSRIKKGL
jgi:hypothetical protein